jgi:hypothetical protein
MTTQQDPFSVETAEAAQFLTGGGAVTAKFPKNGAKVEGTVLSLRVSQKTDKDTGELLFWETKKPTKQSELKFPASATPANAVKQLIIELQCEPTGITWETLKYIEKEVPDDDGIRMLYVSGPEIQRAVGKAVQEHGLKAPEIGGYLQVVKTGEQRIAGTDYFRFLYAAKYTPAAQNEHAAADALAGGASAPEDPFA